MHIDEPIAVALKLSKSGYGSINEILEMSSEIVLSALEFDTFSNELQESFIELNKDKK